MFIFKCLSSYASIKIEAERVKFGILLQLVGSKCTCLCRHIEISSKRAQVGGNEVYWFENKKKVLVTSAKKKTNEQSHEMHAIVYNYNEVSFLFMPLSFYFTYPRVHAWIVLACFTQLICNFLPRTLKEANIVHMIFIVLPQTLPSKQFNRLDWSCQNRNQKQMVNKMREQEGEKTKNQQQQHRN